MSVTKRIFIFSLMFAFLAMGVISMQRAMPEGKEKRIYEAIESHSPFKLEKRVGGLSIISTKDDFKEKPSAAEVLHRKDELDKKWAKTHLSIVNNDVVIKKDDNSTVKIYIQNKKEREFIKSFFGI